MHDGRSTLRNSLTQWTCHASAGITRNLWCFGIHLCGLGYYGRLQQASSLQSIKAAGVEEIVLEMLKPLCKVGVELFNMPHKCCMQIWDVWGQVVCYS